MPDPADYFDVERLLGSFEDDRAETEREIHQPETNDVTRTSETVRPRSRSLTSGETTLVGRDVNGYRVERLIGEGASARVYEARHVYLGRRAALKVLRVPDSSNDRARLLREAALLARLKHPNVLEVYDFGFIDGNEPFMALELVDGPTLENAMPSSGLPLARARRIALDLARGLLALHANGIIHRDLKPSNILLAGTSSGEQAKIADLGLGRGPDATRLTKAGSLLGTPLFMAPEQVRGQDAGEAADAYALGATLFVMLTGSPPFAASSVREILTHHLETEPPALPALGGLGPAVRSLLAKDPRARMSISSLLSLLESGDAGVGSAPKQEQVTDRGPRLRGEPPASEPRGLARPIVVTPRVALIIAAGLVLAGLAAGMLESGAPATPSVPEDEAPASSPAGPSVVDPREHDRSTSGAPASLAEENAPSLGSSEQPTMSPQPAVSPPPGVENAGPVAKPRSQRVRSPEPRASQSSRPRPEAEPGAPAKSTPLNRESLDARSRRVLATLRKETIVLETKRELEDRYIGLRARIDAARGDPKALGSLERELSELEADVLSAVRGVVR
ncbi:MAG: protein kinase [Deltaproteobacteria bacterium]|nr:protein kinase [Deltaproteobacteria bacterium]